MTLYTYAELIAELFDNPLTLLDSEKLCVTKRG